MYRSVLVALKPGSSNDVACRYAVGLAQQQRLRLVGIVVVDPARVAPAEAVPLGGEAYKAQKDAALVEQARQAASDTLQAFADQCKAAGVAGEGHASEGDLPAMVAAAVQRTDLLVVGHRAGQGIVEGESQTSSLHDILKHCPRPAVVVPAVPAPTGHVLLAYDGSRQAARAAQAFVASGLHAHRQVHVLCIQEDPAVAETLASGAVEFLRSHDLPAESHPEMSRGPLAQQILDAARRTQADLLVMGAYGKPSLREFLFGSVTSAVLKAVEVPVLLDH